VNRLGGFLYLSHRYNISTHPSLYSASRDVGVNSAGERAKRASVEEDENTRDESREMATDIMATSTTLN